MIAFQCITIAIGILILIPNAQNKEVHYEIALTYATLPERRQNEFKSTFSIITHIAFLFSYWRNSHFFLLVPFTRICGK